MGQSDLMARNGDNLQNGANDTVASVISLEDSCNLHFFLVDL